MIFRLPGYRGGLPVPVPLAVEVALPVLLQPPGT
jgi:hypothetical protein